MTTTFELLDFDGTTVLAAVTGVGAPGWREEQRGAGAGHLLIHVDHPLYDSLLPDRFIKVTHTHAPNPGSHSFTWILSDFPRQVWGPRGDLHTQWSGPGNLAVMGWGSHDEAIVIENEPNGLCVFGWIAEEWDTSSWISPAPYSGGFYLYPRNPAWKNKPEDFPDDRAEWIISSDSNNPTSKLWVRHTLDYHAAREDAQLYIAGNAKAWLNGEEIYDGESPFEMTRIGVELTGDDLLAVELVARAIWTIGYDVDGVFHVLYRSSTGAPFPVNTDEVQTIVLDPDSPPFPWGSDYPSTGPDNLQGTWAIKLGGHWTSRMQWDNDAGDVQAHLEALPNVDAVSVSGSGTSASPYVVTFPDAGETPTMQLDHSDLRHSHATTAVNVTTQGQSSFEIDPWRHKIAVTDTLPTGVTYGYVMTRLIAAAQARGTILMVSTTATDTHDSLGNPWSVSLPHVAYDAGIQLGNVLQQGWQQFHGHCRMTADFDLLLLDSPGRDLTGTVELTIEEPEAADNVLNQVMSTPNPPGANELMVVTDGGWGWVSSPDPVTSRRRETAAMLGNALSVEEAESAALGILEDNDERNHLAGETTEWAAHNPFLDYIAGDIVDGKYVTDGAYLPVMVSVMTALLDQAGNLLVTIEALEHEGGS